MYLYTQTHQPDLWCCGAEAACLMTSNVPKSIKATFIVVVGALKLATVLYWCFPFGGKGASGRLRNRAATRTPLICPFTSYLWLLKRFLKRVHSTRCKTPVLKRANTSTCALRMRVVELGGDSDGMRIHYLNLLLFVARRLFCCWILPFHEWNIIIESYFQVHWMHPHTYWWKNRIFWWKN